MWAAAAGVTGIALLVAACSSGTDEPSGDGSSNGGGDSGEKITLTVSTFNEFGFADLYKEYEDLHPNITIDAKKAATSDDARAALTTALSAGSGAADIEAADVDWMPELIEAADGFADLSSDSVEGRWPDWKTQQATTPDGKLIGYGTDSGPEAICYRSDLFEAAGLPTDRDEVAQLFGGDDATWEKFFQVGDQFTAAGTGVGFFDSAAAVFQGMVNQLDAPYEDPQTDEITVVDDGADVKALYDQLLAHVDSSAHLTQWSDDWNAAFQSDGFATMLCPAWMTQIIAGNADGVDGWDIADVFPGGGGNWGGSFLLVPAQGQHIEEAKALADWLTAPEQAAKVFATYGNFPSQVEAQTDSQVTSKTDAFFNDAPTGQIFANRFAGVTMTPYKGSHYFAIQNAMAQAIGRVDVDKTDDAASSWTKFLDAVRQLG